MVDLTQLHGAVLRDDLKATQQLVTDALDEGSPPMDLLNLHMIPAMDEVGRLFESGEFCS